MNFHMSLKNKIFFIYVSVAVLSITIVGLYGYKTSAKAYTDSALDLSTQRVNTIDLEIDGVLKSIPQDILYLTEIYAIKQFMIWDGMDEKRKSKEWKEIYVNSLIDFLERKRHFFKIRVIDINSNEIISVRHDSKTNKAVIVQNKMLQSKNGKDYVEVTKKLEKNRFYVSPMNLNTENSEIEKPYIPVMRYATPIYDDNVELKGIFVASIYADTVLDILKKSALEHKKEGVEYFLVDLDGNYLYNADSAKEWNAQLEHGSTFNTEHFDIKSKLKDKWKGSFIEKNKIYSFNKVHSIHEGSMDNYWYIISTVDTSVALAKLENFTYVFTSIVLLILFASFFIIRFYVDRLTLPLSKVTRQLNALSRGEIQKETIEYRDNDEIGQIVNSTRILVDAIETTINQANAVANGDFSKNIELLSKDDKLGYAIQEMTTRLKEIGTLARSLSLGDYDVHILAKGSEDTLGIALVDMVAYLEGITNIAESIARGDLNVKYKSKGSEDRLGQAILQMIKYLKAILKQANAISKDDFSSTIEVKSSSDELGLALEKMTYMLSANSVKNKNEIYFNDGVREFNDALAGISDTVELASRAISLCSRYVDACSGVVYRIDEEYIYLNRVASFAFSDDDGVFSSFKIGEGVVGQVALEKKPILLRNIEDIEHKIKSGTVISKPKEIYVFPLVHEGKLLAVAEIMSFNLFTDLHKDYLLKIASIFAIALYTSAQNAHIKLLLEKSQQSFEELQIQSEELQESNVQMEEQQQQLTIQSQELKDKNIHLAQAKKEIDIRAEELEKASKYKNEFLANMSHELRTPLNSIILLSKLLSMNSDKNLNEDGVKKASVINKAGNDLLLLINDILDLSKIESGNMELDIKAVSTNDIIDDVRGLFESLADEKGVRFVINNNFGDTFTTDKTKLAQVLKNLLSNSFKFTKHGSVTLDINSTDTEVIISVEDTGIGIPSNKLDTIFEAFKQVDGTISREFGGTGLGLSISKTIIEHLNGVIEVESVFGDGTKFTVTLPLNNENKVVKVFNEAESSGYISDNISMVSGEEVMSFDENEFADKNILVVDDDSRNIFTLTSILENMNAEVYSAFNGQEAIETLEREKIDLVLMDVMMPVMDGLRAIENIRSKSKFKNLPIIAITAKTMPQDKHDCLDAGASDYLPKPLNHNALILMLKAWIK